MAMTNEEREEAGKLHWMPAVRLWDFGYSLDFIRKVMGYKTNESFTTRKNQLRKKYPDWFPPRPHGFVPVDKRIYKFLDDLGTETQEMIELF